MKTILNAIGMRVIVLMLLFGAYIPVLYARGTPESSTAALAIHVVRGPSGLGMIRMFETPPRVPNFEVRMEALAGADLIAARFISGEAKVGILPPNVAARIRASGKNIQVAAVIGEGMLSLLTIDPSVEDIDDLRGKTVEVAGQASIPDYVFRTILDVYGITSDRDVQLGYSLAYPEIALSLVAGRISTALLPEPFATVARMGRNDIRSVADIQEEWESAGGESNYPMTFLVVDAAFAAANPGAVQTILAAVKNSIEWVRANPAEAGRLAQKHNFGLRPEVAEAAIGRSNYVFIPAAEARPSIEALFRVLLQHSPASIGGSLPNDGFYWRERN